MRLLFVLSRMAHVRHFDRAVRLLADRGHDVVMASQDGDVELRGPLANQPRVTAIHAPRNRTDEWATAAATIRRGRDYIRYLHPRYAPARMLRERAFERLVAIVSDRRPAGEMDWASLLLALPKPEQKRLEAVLAQLEKGVPPDPAIDRFLVEQQADALVLSPMVGLGFSQADFVKSARVHRIPNAVLLFSWDNLSNKGLIHEAPDRLIVWNEKQREEARKLHAYPPERVVVTGAPRFDAFFEMRPASTRAEFCRVAGLDPERPILTYLCSSKFVAATERVFVDRWLAALRSSGDPRLASCGIVVRPHPTATREWHAAEPADVRWPGSRPDKASVSRMPADSHCAVMHSPMQNADQVLFDTVFHSAAVVGLNTSAEIEAAIVGRPVFTVKDPDAGGQEGTLHFHYLLKANGGHVERADSVEEHCAQLSSALAGHVDTGALRSFIASFIRPAGVETPVAPLVASAIEDLALQAAGPRPPVLSSRS